MLKFFWCSKSDQARQSTTKLPNFFHIAQVSLHNSHQRVSVVTEICYHSNHGTTSLRSYLIQTTHPALRASCLTTSTSTTDNVLASSPKGGTDHSRIIQWVKRNSEICHRPSRILYGLEETARVNEKKETVRYEERKRDFQDVVRLHIPTTKRNQYDTCTLKDLIYPSSSQCDKKPKVQKTSSSALLLRSASISCHIAITNRIAKGRFFFSANTRPKPQKPTNRLSTVRKCPSLSLSLSQTDTTNGVSNLSANLNHQYPDYYYLTSKNFRPREIIRKISSNRRDLGSYTLP